jgi:superoxide reductase
MTDLNTLFQTADWTQEKHVPVIEAPDVVGKGELVRVQVSVGKEIAHPNTTPHHIRWITVFFKPEGAKFPYQIGKAEFSAHGESADGPDTSSVYTHHAAVLNFKTNVGGTIFAASLCNIHGLWQGSKALSVE